MALPSSNSASTIHLDYGADSAPFDCHGLHVCSRGMRLSSPWRFDPGAEIAVNFQLDDGSGAAPRLLKTESVVVDCQPDGRQPHCYRLTMMFLEITDDIRFLIERLAASERAVGSSGPLEKVSGLEPPSPPLTTREESAFEDE